MGKIDIAFDQLLPETLGVLRSEGLFLVGCKKDGTANTMTIGWSAIGTIWGKPMCLVLVRPSRYTYEFLEEVGEFTVNVGPKELAPAASFCGTVSGRDEDKFMVQGLTPVPGRTVRAPIIQECVIHYECKVVHYNDVVPDHLSAEIKDSCYPQGDFHRIYFGEILAAYADPDAGQRVSSPASY